MALRLFRRSRFHHDADQRLGAARAHQHAAAFAHFLFGCHDSLVDSDVSRNRILVGHAHVDELLREAHHRRRRGLGGGVAAGNRSEELACGDKAVARGVVVQEDGVAALLAAQHIAALAHAFEHVAIAYRGLLDLDARFAHGVHEAQVAHDGGNHGVAAQKPALLQVDRACRLYHVAVDVVAMGIHEQHAVRIAVMGDAHMGAGLAHQLAQGLQVGGTALHVDVGAAIILVDHHDLGTQTTQRLGARNGCGTMGHIQCDTPGREIDALAAHAVDRMLDINLYRIVDGHDGSHRVTAGKLVGGDAAIAHEGLDAMLQVDGELVALPVEEFDPVVLRGVMRRADDDAAVGNELAGQQCHGGRGDDAQLQHIAACGHDACVQSGFQHVAGKARVLAHHDGLAQEANGSLTQLERDIAGQFLIRHTTGTIGTEQLCHYFPLFTNSPCRRMAPSGRSSAHMRMFSSAANSSTPIPKRSSTTSRWYTTSAAS